LYWQFRLKLRLNARNIVSDLAVTKLIVIGELD
jgi:hypothetical protein